MSDPRHHDPAVRQWQGVVIPDQDKAQSACFDDGSRRDRPAFDPTLPPRGRRRLAGYWTVTSYHPEPVFAWDGCGRPEWGLVALLALGGTPVVIGALIYARWLIDYALGGPALRLPGINPVYLVAWIAVLAVIAAAGFGPLAYAIWTRRRYRGRFVDYEMLDEPGRQLLARAQAAASAVTTSRGAAEGLLEEPHVTTVGQVWEIACQLRDLAAGSRQHTAASASGQDISAAIEDARASVAGRVEALERYAAAARHVDEALDVGERDAARTLAEDRSMDLHARSAADQHAITDIDRQASRAALLAQQLRTATGDGQ